MAGWRVRQRYGVGAGGVVLCAEPYLPPLGLPLDARAVRDFALTTLPTLCLAMLVCLATAVTLFQSDAGPAALEVVVIARETPEQLVLPEPVVTPEPVPVPVPRPVVTQVAVEPPPPPPKPVPPPAPKPVVAPVPAPAPVARMARVNERPPPPRPTPAPAATPRPVPKLASFEDRTLRESERQARQVREQPRNAIARPRIAGAAALPSEPTPAAPSRARRFAAVRAPEPGARARPETRDIGAIAAPAIDESSRPSRSRAVRTSTAPRAKAEPRLAFAPAAPAFSDAAPVTARRAREVAMPAPRPQRRVASLALPAPKASAPAERAEAAPARAAIRSGKSGQIDRSVNPALAGVPLASLAACVSERREEALKRRIVAAVTAQRECKSPAGTYRFVETKNLNAFLMMIERPPHRPVSDRCAELTNALACLARPARR